MTSIEYGNGTTSTCSYTSGGLLKTLQHGTLSDANNRTASLDGGSALYRHDAGGSRVQKVTASQTTSYFFGVAEYVSGSGWSKLYITTSNG